MDFKQEFSTYSKQLLHFVRKIFVCMPFIGKALVLISKHLTRILLRKELDSKAKIPDPEAYSWPKNILRVTKGVWGLEFSHWKPNADFKAFGLTQLGIKSFHLNQSRVCVNDWKKVELI